MENVKVWLGPAVTLRRPVPVKAAFSWLAPEPIAPQVAAAFCVEPNFRVLMVCVPEKLRFTRLAVGEAGRRRVALAGMAELWSSWSAVPEVALMVTEPAIDPETWPTREPALTVVTPV